MVIQEGALLPSDFITGRRAEVNASINIDMETTPLRGGRLGESGNFCLTLAPAGAPADPTCLTTALVV